MTSETGWVLLAAVMIASWTLGFVTGWARQRYTWERDIKPELDAYDRRYRESLDDLFALKDRSHDA